MSACLSPEVLAALAAGEGAPGGDGGEAAAHAESCAACRREVAAQRELRALLGAVPAPRLARARREELAAEVLARADERPVQRRARRRVIAVVAPLAVAAAAAAVVLAVRGPAPSASEPTRTAERPGAHVRDSDSASSAGPGPQRPDPGQDPAGAVRAAGGVRAALPGASDPAPGSGPAEPALAASGAAEAAGSSNGGPDAEPSAEPGQAPGGPSENRTGSAAGPRRPAVRSNAVFAGAGEATGPGRRRVVEAGTIWDGTGAPPSATALAAFREGWTALREQRHAAAIAAFDRAADPVIAEDAAYWAAIAAERAGDHAAARRRLSDFLARFPASPRAPAARLAVERLSLAE